MLRQYWNGVLRETEGSPEGPSYDLIVVGLGTAGSVAAITAARQGLRVLGLEQLPAMGGQGTLGYVMPYYFGGPGGLFEELDPGADGQGLRGDQRPPPGLQAFCPGAGGPEGRGGAFLRRGAYRGLSGREDRQGRPMAPGGAAAQRRGPGGPGLHRGGGGLRPQRL